MPRSPSFVRWFSAIGIADVPSVGGKNASLGELYRELSVEGVRVPDGFAITADGYERFLVRCGIDSISLNPDAVVSTTQVVLDAEAPPACPREAHARAG